MMMIVLFSACLAAGVSMFCAALLLSCPCVEISIYSTCKRISQKILRNVFKFAMMIADQDMATINCAILRENMEEIYLRGPLGSTDVRIINSYPSKVSGAKTHAKVAPNVAPAPRQKSRPRRAAQISVHAPRARAEGLPGRQSRSVLRPRVKITIIARPHGLPTTSLPAAGGSMSSPETRRSIDCCLEG